MAVRAERRTWHRQASQACNEANGLRARLGLPELNGPRPLGLAGLRPEVALLTGDERSPRPYEEQAALIRGILKASEADRKRAAKLAPRDRTSAERALAATLPVAGGR